MKKRNILQLMAQTFCLCLLVACSQTSKTDYLNVIPADADILVSFDMKALADKVGLNGANAEVKETFIGLVADMAPFESRTLIEELLKEPEKTGVDFTVPSYFYASQRSAAHASLVFKTKDEGQVAETLKKFEEKKITSGIQQGKGYRYAKLTDETLVLVFNESLLLVTEEKDLDSIADWLKRKKERSIVSQTRFEQLQKQKGDIRLVTPLSYFAMSYMSYLTSRFSDIPKEGYNDSFLMAGLSFENGEAALSTRIYTENKVMLEAMERQKAAFGKATGVFAKNFAVETPFYMNTRIDGAEFYKLLLSYAEKADEDEIKLLKSDVLKDFICSFRGDMAMAVEMGDSEYSEPIFTMYAEVTDARALASLFQSRALVNWISEASITEMARDEYRLQEGNMSIYFGVRDKQFYLTTSERAYRELGKKQEKSLLQAPFADEIKSTAFVSINLFPIVSLWMGNGFNEAVSQIESFTIQGEDETVFRLRFKEKGKNSLQQIIDLIANTR